VHCNWVVQAADLYRVVVRVTVSTSTVKLELRKLNRTKTSEVGLKESYIPKRN
jgi:hypothetical protein